MKKLLFIAIFAVLLLQNKAQTLTDADGNTYNTVTIGTQVWMKENLKTTKYNDGTIIPNITDRIAWTKLTTPAYCWFENDASKYKATYGALYNWYTVNTGKLCPTGWHVPTDREWSALGNYLIANSYNYDGTKSGNKYAKALASDTGWIFSNKIGSVGNTDYPEKRNATKFTALSGGASSYNGIFRHFGYDAYWWSSTSYDATHAYFRMLLFQNDYFTRNYNIDMRDNSLTNGFSIRCIKDINTSVENIGIQSTNYLYPNPAFDKLYIKNIKHSNAQIMIFDLQGKQVVNSHIGSNPIIISSLAKGVYMVKIIDSGRIIVDKLIKE